MSNYRCINCSIMFTVDVGDRPPPGRMTCPAGCGAEAIPVTPPSTNELLDLIHELVEQSCWLRGTRQYEYIAIGAYADALKILEDHGLIRIVQKAGRRVIAERVEVTP